jgi:hypothetical protein
MIRWSCGALVGLALGVAALAAAEPADKVELRSVTTAELEKALAGLKGKVVVVDFWAEY